MRSRVIPGSSVTIERRVPVSRLKIVDLPTLGRPTITTEGSFSVIFSVAGDTTNLKWEARNLLVYPTGDGNRSITPSCPAMARHARDRVLVGQRLLAVPLNLASAKADSQEWLSH